MSVVYLAAAAMYLCGTAYYIVSLVMLAKGAGKLHK